MLINFIRTGKKPGFCFPIVLGFVLFCIAGCSPGNPENNKAKKNVLFIAVDDLRADLCCHKNQKIQTPNLDKLAFKGSIFSKHFVQVPTCGASRHSLLTGMRPTKRVHLSNNVTASEISDKTEGKTPETFIHQFRRNGYHTVGIGKISHSADGLLYGYDEKASTKRELPFSWDELLFNSGKWGTGWNAFFGYANGENRQSLNRQVKPYESADTGDEGYVDGLTAQLAISKLRELKARELKADELKEGKSGNENKPFFLGLGFFKPHLPFNAPKKYWDLYETENISISPNPGIPEGINISSLHNSAELNGYHLTDEVAGLSHPVSDNYAKKLRHGYFASVSYIDAQIGKVLDELETLGLADNTIVVVWGDHGWHLGDQQMWGKHTIFENALKSTLIIKDPDAGLSNNIVETIVETVDIYPTLLALCNIPLPYQTDGDSLVNLLNTVKLASPEIESEINREEVAYSYFKEGISLRTKQYRLTKYFREEEPGIELYDHFNDPYETKNLASTYPQIVKNLMPVLEKGNTGLYDR